jgi:hypothetical protein
LTPTSLWNGAKATAGSVIDLPGNLIELAAASVDIATSGHAIDSITSNASKSWNGQIDARGAGSVMGGVWAGAVISGGLSKGLSTANTATPMYRTWNQFQSGTAGQFSSRSAAAAAWTAYKSANGVAAGTKRCVAARSEFLRGMAVGGKAPSWMNQWLQKGKVPPGYHVDHIKPLSIGGADAPSNMRLLDIDMHTTHHRFYRPWE